MPERKQFTTTLDDDLITEFKKYCLDRKIPVHNATADALRAFMKTSRFVRKFAIAESGEPVEVLERMRTKSREYAEKENGREET